MLAGVRDVIVVGISHELTQAALREWVHVDLAGARSLARGLAGADGECVVLATCNRTELYLASVDRASAVERARTAILRLAGPAAPALRAGVFVRERAEAVVHLFRVASGLESLILGEAEILGQVRRALTAGAPGPVLDRLFAHALRTGRRVRAETELARGPGSVPAAAAALVEREPVGQVLILGAGKMAELVALNLRSRGERAIVIANRTVERGEQLARRVGGRAVSLDAVREELACADAVICATSSPDLVVTQRTVRTRGGRPLFLIDLALPRDVDPRVADVPGCRLVGLDDLRTVVDATSCARERGIVCAEAIVDEEAARFAAWHRARSAAAAIAALHRNADEIRSSILARHAAALTALGPEAGRLVDVLTAQLVAALLHAPTVALKGESGDVTGASPAHGPTLAA